MLMQVQVTFHCNITITLTAYNKTSLLFNVQLLQFNKHFAETWVGRHEISGVQSCTLETNCLLELITQQQETNENISYVGFKIKQHIKTEGMKCIVLGFI